jgi:hypothetical protein
VAPSLPFHLQYTLSRRQRLATEIYPWLPAIAGTIGFVLGVVYLSIIVSSWFLFLLLLPVVAYRGLFVFLFDIAVHARQSVDVLVDETQLGVRVEDEQRWLPLDGIIQVFRSEDGTTWTVLHFDGSVITIPADAVTGEQLDYLKSFARRAAEERRAARSSD